LPEGVNNNRPCKEPEDPEGKKLIKVELEFKRLRLPNDKVFYFTVAMAIIAVAIIVLTAVYEGKMLADPFHSIVGGLAMILLITSTLVNAFSAYLQQK
jgi:hypothetical protein